MKWYSCCFSEPEVSEQELASIYSGGVAKKLCTEGDARSGILSVMDTSITQSAVLVEKQIAQQPKHPNPFLKAKPEDIKAKQPTHTSPKQFSESKPDRKQDDSTTEILQSPKAKVQPSPAKTPSPSSKNPFKKMNNSTSKRFMLNEQKTEVVSR